MRGSAKDTPAAIDLPEATIRFVDWGGMTIETGEVRQGLDLATLLVGLPDDKCQCPHWGYVIKGQLRYKTATGEEVFNAGDFYYVGPGHTPVFTAGTEYVEYSSSDQLAKTMEVAERNMAAGVQPIAV